MSFGLTLIGGNFVVRVFRGGPSLELLQQDFGWLPTGFSLALKGSP
jgi:hypothetical protein